MRLDQITSLSLYDEMYFVARILQRIQHVTLPRVDGTVILDLHQTTINITSTSPSYVFSTASEPDTFISLLVTGLRGDSGAYGEASSLLRWSVCMSTARAVRSRLHGVFHMDNQISEVWDLPMALFLSMLVSVVVLIVRG